MPLWKFRNGIYASIISPLFLLVELLNGIIQKDEQKERKTKRRKKEGKKRRMFDTLCKHSVNSGKTKKYRAWAQVLQRVYSIVT